MKIAIVIPVVAVAFFGAGVAIEYWAWMRHERPATISGAGLPTVECDFRNGLINGCDISQSTIEPDPSAPLIGDGDERQLLWGEYHYWDMDYVVASSSCVVTSNGTTSITSTLPMIYMPR
jgi:hypothetical protein